MKKRNLLLTVACAAGLGITPSCTQESNPLLTEWTTPYGIPPFDQVDEEDYMPAFLEAMKQHKDEIEAIVSNPEEAGFENTIAAYDRAGALLNRINAVFGSASNVRSTEGIMAIETELSPLLSRHYSEIALNEQLFERIRRVYDRRNELNLNSDQMRLLTETYKRFERSGALLPPSSKKRLMEINAELAACELAFDQNVLKETASYVLEVTDETRLGGLSDAFLKAAADRAAAVGKPGAWFFGLDNPSVIPFLQSADDRNYRQEMFDAYINRGNRNTESDNKDNIVRQVTLRLEKAQILGYPDFASYALADRMAKTPEAVYELLDKIWEPALESARMEFVDLQEMARKDGLAGGLTGADWRYYAEKVRKNRFNLSDEELKPYFSYDRVLDGIFYVAGRLYGLSFEPLDRVPLPHPEATAYTCKDADGSLLGLLFVDMFARPAEKRGGAWCTTYRDQTYENGKRVIPLVAIAGNFSRPVGEYPALLTPDEVETFFHEFGHALQALLQDVPYAGLGNITRDFVELPSQINEHWAFEPEVLRHYALHYRTGEPIPEELVNRLKASGKYGQGFATTEFLAAALLDMDYHVLREIPVPFNPVHFEEVRMSGRGLLPQIPPRYRSTYFRHTFTGGYTAGYYSYIWAEVLDCDAYRAFVETGDIFDPRTATAFRKEILERGGADDAMTLYLNFRGRKPGIDALLENRGLKH